MTLENALKINSWYEDMTLANMRALAATEKYKEREEQIKEKVTRNYSQQPLAYRKRATLADKIREEKDIDYWLKKHYNRYKFWQSEVLRLSALIVATKALES